MRVRITSQPSGLVDLGDGRGLREWPAAGDEIVVPDDEGARLCATGQASPVADLEKPETRRKKSEA